MDSNGFGADTGLFRLSSQVNQAKIVLRWSNSHPNISYVCFELPNVFQILKSKASNSRRLGCLIRLVRQWRYQDSTVHNWYKHNVWIRQSEGIKTGCKLVGRKRHWKAAVHPVPDHHPSASFALWGNSFGQMNQAVQVPLRMLLSSNYFMLVGLTSCDFRLRQLWQITWMQNVFG